MKAKKTVRAERAAEWMKKYGLKEELLNLPTRDPPMKIHAYPQKSRDDRSHQ